MAGTSSLPHRQLRKLWFAVIAGWVCSLPHRQLRNQKRMIVILQ